MFFPFPWILDGQAKSFKVVFVFFSFSLSIFFHPFFQSNLLKSICPISIPKLKILLESRVSNTVRLVPLHSYWQGETNQTTRNATNNKNTQTMQIKISLIVFHISENWEHFSIVWNGFLRWSREVQMCWVTSLCGILYVNFLPSYTRSLTEKLAPVTPTTAKRRKAHLMPAFPSHLQDEKKRRACIRI